jgi:hypothetical protein
LSGRLLSLGDPRNPGASGLARALVQQLKHEAMR